MAIQGVTEDQALPFVIFLIRCCSGCGRANRLPYPVAYPIVNGLDRYCTAIA
jgi:hypothetical protein